MGGNFLSTDAALLPIRSFAQMHEGAWGNYRLLGDRYPSTPNEPNGMVIDYYLKSAPTGSGSDSAAAAVPQGRGSGRAGRGGGSACVSDPGDGSRPSLTIADAEGRSVCILMPPSHAGLNQAFWNLNGANGPAQPGEYTFTLKAGDRSYTQKARLVSVAPR
jgi:hypothetical protein